MFRHVSISIVVRIVVKRHFRAKKKPRKRRVFKGFDKVRETGLEFVSTCKLWQIAANRAIALQCHPALCANGSKWKQP